MSPSKPLTEKQRLKRRHKRELEVLLADIAAGGLVRAPDGRLGYFVPTAHDPTLRPGEARFIRGRV